ncbi:MAG: PaaI family thioesterase [Myxococcales bacterium]|jgi:acyl-coenzyme A thioesterase PaaI-like protein|nr:PaaI family thioesterase [Myxococcales bacterium]
MSDDERSRGERVFSFWSAAGSAVTGAWAERRRLAAAMRQVIDRLTTSDAPEEELRAAADALDRYAARLASHPRRTLPLGFGESANAGDVAAFFDYSPLIGLSNPLAPPIVLEVEGQVVHGRVRFGAAYEGPPGHVHGGFVAAAFDEVLGFVQSTTGQPGMTATLTIRYRKPTPLDTDLRFEATVRRVEGRKIFAEGRLYDGDILTADAEGLFISVDLVKMQLLAEAKKARQNR